jgi:hypothetical protein
MGKTGARDEESVDVILPEGFGASFSERAVRAGFIRKVYSILLSQVNWSRFFRGQFCTHRVIR